MSWVAIVNPAAGGGRCGKRAPSAIADLRARGLDVEVRETSRAGDATEIARREQARGATHFLAIGGDGTSFEVVNGLFEGGGTPPPVLGMLPLGTGNSFLRDFGVTSTDGAAAALARGTEHRCDVLRVAHAGGTVHSINLVGVGFSATAGALTNRRFKGLGVAGYVLAVLRTAISLEAPVFPVRLDGGERDARPAILLSFCNSRCTAGTMRMAPNAEVADGMLDVIRVGPRSRSAFFASFPSIFAGTHVGKPGVEERRARKVELDLDRPVDCMIDGEVLSLRLRSIEVLPSVLRVVA